MAMVQPFWSRLINVLAFLYRYASNALQRQQTRWVLVGIAAAALCFIAAGGLPLIIWPDIATTGSVAAFVFNYTGIRAGMLLIPLTIGIAILRNRLWNIDLILHRTLVYGGLTASVVGMYIIVVGYFSIGFKMGNNPLISLLATGIIAIAFQPLREQVQRRVNRLIYGQRDEPHTLLARLGEQLEHALTPQTVLPMLVETIASELKLPFAAIALRYADSEMIVATYGTPQQECTRFPLTYQSETVGDLLVAPRSPGEAFAAADHRLFTVLAGQASMVAYSLRLTNELQQMTRDLLYSRAQLVGAREEERRRLRRELHDGVGPTLASLLQRIDATQYLVHEDPDAAIARLKDLKTQVRTTVADIRHLVYALRPPTIDELGLLSAIREHVMQAARKECIVHIEATPEPLPALPAAVEIAAYRIVLEAFTNVQRHAHATTCDICLNTEDTADGQVLTVTVADNGQGLPPEYHTGVGMLSMRERCSELGGSIQFAPEQHGGLHVHARLPFPAIPTNSLTRAQGEDIHGDKRKREHNTTADR
jgi:signal transduction histidine kinase